MHVAGPVYTIKGWFLSRRVPCSANEVCNPGWENQDFKNRGYTAFIECFSSGNILTIDAAKTIDDAVEMCKKKFFRS
jgi:hypothetical protein